MPSFRKVSPAEIAREYDAYLVGFAVGDYGMCQALVRQISTMFREQLCSYH